MDFCTVVTGAASGIGQAVVKCLLAEGRAVCAADRTEVSTEVYGAVGERLLCVACDLATEAGFNVLTAAIRGRFKAVDGFVHCAGFVRTAPLGYILADDAKAMFDVHALFPMRFLGWLAKKQNHAEQTSCVLISSMACHEGDRGNVAYAAAKGAVEGMLKSAAAELVSKGIRINALVLGVVDTPLARASWMNSASEEKMRAMSDAYPLGFGSPDKVASVVKFFVGPDSGWITGQTLVCDGGHALV